MKNIAITEPRTDNRTYIEDDADGRFADGGFISCIDLISSWKNYKIEKHNLNLLIKFDKIFRLNLILSKLEFGNKF